MDDESLQQVYCWVDEIALSRPKRNISRDFNDGVLMAEIVSSYFPRIVELHNYSAANSVRQKLYNWNTLNTKVFKKVGYQISQKDINNVVKCVPGVIEQVLFDTKQKLDSVRASGGPPRARPAEKRGKGNRSARNNNPNMPGRNNNGPPRESKFNNNQNQQQYNAPWQPSVGQQEVRGGGVTRSMRQGVDEEILIEKEETIQELRETVEILELKVKKLEQLVRLKDSKIQALQNQQM